MIAGPGTLVDRLGTSPAVRRLDQFVVQRLDQLAPADPNQIRLEPEVGGLVVVADSSQEPLVGHLRVPHLGEPERLIELRHLAGGQRLGHRLQEVQPLLGRPVAGLQHRGRRLAARPARSLLLDPGQRIRHRTGGVGRQPGLLEPGVDLQRLGQIGVGVVSQQMRVQIGDEVAGGDTAEREMVEVGTQERVEARATDSLLEQTQEQIALEIGHLVHTVVRVAPLQIDVQDLVGRLQPRQFLVQRLAVEGGLHVHARAAEDLLQDAALEIDRDAFVQPEVAPGGVGHEIARPRVRELVCHERDQALVPGDDGRRGERQPRVLHATERKAGRQHQ